MRIVNELTMRGESANLDRMLARVDSLLRDGWTRDREAEGRLGHRGVLGSWSHCYSCTEKADRPAAGFWIHARRHGELSIDHVISLGLVKLSADDAHRILAEFQREFLGPAAAEVGVETNLVQRRLTVEHEMTPEAVRLLRAFSASANRTQLRPIDRKLWNSFLVRAHKDELLIAPALLDEWLQLEGWPEASRSQLVSEHETALSLLSAYDEEGERR